MCHLNRPRHSLICPLCPTALSPSCHTVGPLFTLRLILLMPGKSFRSFLLTLRHCSEELGCDVYCPQCVISRETQSLSRLYEVTVNGVGVKKREAGCVRHGRCIVACLQAVSPSPDLNADFRTSILIPNFQSRKNIGIACSM